MRHTSLHHGIFRQYLLSVLRALIVALAAASPAILISPAAGQEDGQQDQAVPSGWTKSKTIAAAEAFQAAAADEMHLYAISNAQVARYDRTSGRRVAVSQGEAKHLNSGFFWEGKLYCAHSNYPRTPEVSEIKVLDVETMRLSTFKDFGNFGGSLTWAIRRDGHWWCNFGHYGEENDRTFLVKFDDQWREQGRWTYPTEVIDQLGRYSLSGGIWHGDHLLVTGHDDPLVFRLRLPQQGNVLEYVDRLAVPFTGQGIAHDPVSGGLVGIDRARREIVLAENESNTKEN